MDSTPPLTERALVKRLMSHAMHSHEYERLDGQLVRPALRERSEAVVLDKSTFLSSIKGRIDQGYVHYLHGRCRLQEVQSLAFDAYCGFDEAASHGYTRMQACETTGKKMKSVRLICFLDMETLFCERGESLEPFINENAWVEWCLMALPEFSLSCPQIAWRDVGRDCLLMFGHQMIVSKGVGKRDDGKLRYDWSVPVSELDRRNREIHEGIRVKDDRKVNRALDFTRYYAFWRVEHQMRAMVKRACKRKRLEKDVKHPWSIKPPLPLWFSREVLMTRVIVEFAEKIDPSFRQTRFDWSLFEVTHETTL